MKISRFARAALSDCLRFFGLQAPEKSKASSPAVVFSEIYRRNMWGGTPGEFYSGPGSDEKYSAPFAGLVNEFVAKNQVESIVDLGCGDYRTGRLIARPGVSYLGVDVVEALIRRNNELFGNRDVSFQCIDIIHAELPNADLCILRQVLQHLSNAQIKKILARLGSFYRWAIVGEHHPSPARLQAVNLDRPARFDTRVESDSGVFLEQPPFALPNVTVLARLPLPYLIEDGETLAVYLIDFSTQHAVRRLAPGPG
jgi:SAM-dependent methyltransferase